MASSGERLPVVLGRTALPTTSINSITSKPSNKSEPTQAELAELQDSEATCGQVFIAMNMTRGMPWFRREKDPGWFVVGNRKVVERLNQDWLDKTALEQLCEDITVLSTDLQLFESEPYVLCKSEKYCGCCLLMMSAVLVAATFAWGALHAEQEDDGANDLMIACGVLLSVTIMCCFCMNFRRKRMMDWEVPHGDIKRFAARWGKKHGFHLTFQLNFDGPSYFVLKPKQQASQDANTDSAERQICEV